MNVLLTPELEQFIAMKVGSGEYHSASEVVKDSLRLLVAAEDFLNTKLTNETSAKEAFLELWQAKLRGAIQEGMNGPHLDAEEAFRQIRAGIKS